MLIQTELRFREILQEAHLVTLLMNRDWPLEKNLPVNVVSAGCAISGLYDLEPVRTEH